MRRVRAVVFDYGHTLVDFSRAEENLLDCYESVRGMLETQATARAPEAEQLIRHVSNRVEALVEDSYSRRELEELDIIDLFDAALRSMGLSVAPEVSRQIVEAEHRAVLSHLTVSRNHLDTLRTLREHGVKTGLVSNAHFLPELMREDIERLGIAEHNDDAVFSAEVGVRKPHPAIFMKVLDALDVAPRDAFFVGDRIADDVHGAQRLGMTGVLTQEFRAEDPAEHEQQPDYVVQRLPEVLAIVLPPDSRGG